MPNLENWIPVPESEANALVPALPLGKATEEKSVEDAEQLSIQARAREADPDTGVASIGLLGLLASAGEIMPPWWSKRRDRELRRFWMRSDHVSGAFFTICTKLISVPLHVEARDPSVKAHVRQADDYTRYLVEESEFAHGWLEAFAKFLLDSWSTDNGAFWEVIGRGDPDGPIVGSAVGLSALDSGRCDRTLDPTYPVVYTDTDDRKYKLHRSRVVMLSQMPSNIVEMRSVGFCWMSRCLNTAQNLYDISVFKQEKLGSRPLRAIAFAPGVRAGLIQSALAQAASYGDAQALKRFSKIPIIEDIPPDADLKLIDFASLPDGYDEEESTSLGMYAIALAGGVPPRWLWPATTVGATKADALYQHVAGVGGGAGAMLRAVSTLLGGSDRGARHETGKFLPPHLRLVFDFQDTEQNRAEAQIAEIRSRTRERELSTGAVTVRVARERALNDGDLTQAQFDQLELDDGRLPDGSDAIALFEVGDPLVTPMLDVGVAEPLDVRGNDPEEMLYAIGEAKRHAAAREMQANSARNKTAAERAGAALEALETLYEEEQAKRHPPQQLFPAQGTQTQEEEEEHDTPGGEKPPDQDLEEGGAEDRYDEYVNAPKAVEKALTEDGYQKAINSAVRGLWSGVMDYGEFWDAMNASIFRGLTAAWNEGAAKCGVSPGELTSEELQERQKAIYSEFNHVNDFAEAIEDKSKDNGGKLGPLLSRAKLWGNRYRDLINRAKIAACKDKKMIWTLGDTCKHCPDCLKYEGRVYRASVWDKWDVRPQHPGLACNGFNCKCSLDPTDAPANKGRPPKLSGG